MSTVTATISTNSNVLNQAGVDLQAASSTVQNLIPKMPADVGVAVMNALMGLQQKVAAPLQASAGILQSLVPQVAAFEAKVASLAAKQAQLDALAASLVIQGKALDAQWAVLSGGAVWNQSSSTP